MGLWSFIGKRVGQTVTIMEEQKKKKKEVMGMTPQSPGV